MFQYVFLWLFLGIKPGKYTCFLQFCQEKFKLFYEPMGR